MVNPEDLSRIRAAVDKRLHELPPATVTFSRALIRPEAVVLPASPVEPFSVSKQAIRAGIAEVLGLENVPESANIEPHISLGYSNAELDAGSLSKQ